MKKVFSIILSVAVTVASFSTTGLTNVSAATDTIMVAPENVLNVQVVDENGAPVNGVSMTLENSQNETVATWTSGNSDVAEENHSGIVSRTYFNEQWHSFEELVAPYDLKKIKVNGEDWYNTIRFNDAEAKTIDIYYDNTSLATDLTVPAGQYVTFVDSDWATRSNRAWEISLENSNDDVVYEALLKNIVGEKAYSLAAGDYDLYLECEGSASSCRSITVSSVATEYIKVRIKLSEYCGGFNDDGTGNHDGKTFNFSKDTGDTSAVLIFTSGAVISAAIPDAQGYVEIYVDKSTKKFIWDSQIEYGIGSVGGAFNGLTYVYDKKTVTAQAIDLPNVGTNLLYVPAGDYTVEFTDVPAGYKSGTKSITVAQSQNVQTLQIVLEKEHVHAADTSEWLNDADEHWHKCTGCDTKLDNATHTPGADATESAAQTCTVCGYELAPKLEHVHKYADEYKADEENHWKECACGSKADVNAHEFSWITDKQATATEAGLKHEECTACNYKLPATEIPALGNQEPETKPQEEKMLQSETKPQPEVQPISQQEAQKPATLQTGDNTLSILWISLLLVSIGACAVVNVAGKKKESAE